MITVNIKNDLKNKNLSVNQNGSNGTSSTINPNGATVCALTGTQGNAEWVQIAVTEPVMEYTFKIEVPPTIEVSITSQEQGKDWKLMFTPVTVTKLAGSGNNDNILLGDDSKVNVTVGQDEPPAKKIAPAITAGACLGTVFGMVLGHFIFKLSPSLWTILIIILLVLGIIFGISLFKNEDNKAG